MESNKICRSCLRNTENLRNIFSTEEILGQHVQLSEILASCFSVLITKNDGYSENICLKCFQLAKLSYLFRKLLKALQQRKTCREHYDILR
ncbi:unnamed protein product [Callosobruchus maculatus]|uniref:ZAD domain-containing protein n=1 Tax=Callosobruchus maculatus TaxID=64391 RepID=A0A653DX09_CALMS|nr:unnamed protein product [Callosobruchus maculatus]